jgi:ribosomal protein S18
MYDTIERIDAYLNSVHITGADDSLGRPKPFFNIVTANVNVWYHATDLDRKNIRIMPSKLEDTMTAFVATAHLQEWMRRARFGRFLNDWGRALARYGSAVVKFVEKDGELTASVVPWSRFVADPVQFDARPRIEKFYMTPAQLRKNKSYDQEMVTALIDAVAARKTMDGMKKDNQDDFIELYEVHGELDIRLLEDEPDEGDDEDIQYRQQMHVISFLEQKGGDYKDFTLYKGKEKKDPYMLTHLIEEEGRTLSIGAVEACFHAQWMVNHSVKNMKDTLDLASKLIFQTADTKFAGRNVLAAIETGDIFIHAANMPVTRLANDKPDIQAFMQYGQMWKTLSSEITSTPDAVKGNTLPSGTPYSLGALLTDNANNLFKQMTENKGLHVEDMLTEHIIPHIKTKMDTKDELMATLSADMIAEIDAMYLPQEAVKQFNQRALDTMLKNVQNLGTDAPQDPMAPFDPAAETGAIQKSFGALGNKRSFSPDDIGEKTWKAALEDLEWNVKIEITDETTDKQAVLTTLSTVLQTIASNPAILQDKNAQMVMGAILTETGRISPIQLSASSAQPQAQPAQTDALNNLVKA